jgi:hypothetical protein
MKTQQLIDHLISRNNTVPFCPLLSHHPAHHFYRLRDLEMILRKLSLTTEHPTDNEDTRALYSINTGYWLEIPGFVHDHITFQTLFHLLVDLRCYCASGTVNKVSVRYPT